MKSMRIIKNIANRMVQKAKKSNYNCSPMGFYKPSK